MLLKNELLQKKQYKLSPIQIKLMKLVQLSTLDFEKIIQKEIEENPALEENLLYDSDEEFNIDILNKENKINEQKGRFYEHFNNSKIEYYKNNNFKINNINIDNVEENNIFITYNISFQEYLKNQLNTFTLNKEDLLISEFILGNIDDDGYLRIKSKNIVNDIFIIMGKLIKEDKIEYLIKKYIQKLEPIGTGSRNIQECLLIQLNEIRNKNLYILLAIKMVKNYFNYFVKKYYLKLQKKLNVTKNELKQIIFIVKKLNPKPGRIYSENIKISDNIIPDFTIYISDNEKLELVLNKSNYPNLKISCSYLNMLKYYKNLKRKYKTTIVYINNKINSAKLFIDTVKKRKNTLISTMNAIINYQKEYFLTGDILKIKPMILKNISEKIGVDISTVSRVANNKYVNTPYGTFLIKSFFSEKIKNIKGKYISSIEIKKLLDESISKENKEYPFTDYKLSEILKKQGYIIARRTITKYRDQMNIPIASMRKSLL